MFVISGRIILVKYYEFIDDQVKFAKCDQTNDDDYTLMPKSNILKIMPAKIDIINQMEDSVQVESPQNYTGSIELKHKNNISVNLFGGPYIISIAYERQFIINPRFFITTKLGIGYNSSNDWKYFRAFSPSKESLTIPHHITLNIGKNNIFFEFGVGGTI